MATIGADRRAKLFETGRGQAVRLPKQFRFAGNEVRIRRVGNTVVLEPVADSWEWLHEIWSEGPALSMEAVASVDERLIQEARPELDRIFQ